MHIYTEVSVSNTDRNLSLEQIIYKDYFLGSLRMCKKSVSLINTPQGPEDQNREFYRTLFNKIFGKKKKKKHYTYAEYICHN